MRMLKKILASVLLSMSMAAYAADIPVELMEILEKIPRSTYHSVMRTLLATQDDVDFSGAASDPKSNFFVEYYNLIQELRQKNS